MSSAGSSPWMQSCEGRKLATCLHLLLRLKKSGTVSLLLLYACMVCKANFIIYLRNLGMDGLAILNTSFILIIKFNGKELGWIQTKNFFEVKLLCLISMQHECHKTPATLVKQAIKYCTSCCISSIVDVFKEVEKITQIWLSTSENELVCL